MKRKKIKLIAMITLYVGVLNVIALVGTRYMERILPYTLMYYVVDKRIYEMLSNLVFIFFVYGVGSSFLFKVEIMKSKKS